MVINLGLLCCTFSLKLSTISSIFALQEAAQKMSKKEQEKVHREKEMAELYERAQKFLQIHCIHRKDEVIAKKYLVLTNLIQYFVLYRHRYF